MKTKKFKRIIALVLALTLMFALAAMTASAATARGVICLKCGSSKTNSYIRVANLRQETVSSCSSVQGPHLHSWHRDVTMLRCNNCKYETAMSVGSDYILCHG